MRIGKIASILGATALGLGLSLTGALAANAAGTYQVYDECGTVNDHVTVTGDYTFGYVKPEAVVGSPTSWAVADVVAGQEGLADPQRFIVAQGVFTNVPCPAWTPPPAPSPSPTTEAPAPQQQTVTVTPKSQTTTKSTVTAPTATAPKSEAPATDTPATVTAPTTAPTTEATTEPTAEPETLTATAASDTTPDGNLIIPIGGAALIAGALTTLGIGIGKLGWFRH